MSTFLVMYQTYHKLTRVSWGWFYHGHRAYEFAGMLNSDGLLAFTFKEHKRTATDPLGCVMVRLERSAEEKHFCVMLSDETMERLVPNFRRQLMRAFVNFNANVAA